MGFLYNAQKGARKPSTSLEVSISADRKVRGRTGDYACNQGAPQETRGEVGSCLYPRKGGSSQINLSWGRVVGDRGRAEGRVQKALSSSGGARGGRKKRANLVLAT